MITSIDLAILDFIQEHMRSGAADVIMKLFTAIGDHGIVYIALALIMLCIGKTRKTGTELAFSLIIGFILCNVILKNAIARVRPYNAVDFPIIVAPLSDYSFPSGHTFFAFAFAAIIFSRWKKWGVAAYVLATIIGFSRLYLYVHYPTDVIAGALLGAATGCGAKRICEYIRNKFY